MFVWVKILFLSDFFKFFKRVFLLLFKCILGILSLRVSVFFMLLMLIFLFFLGLIFFFDFTLFNNLIVLFGKNLLCM